MFDVIFCLSLLMRDAVTIWLFLSPESFFLPSVEADHAYKNLLHVHVNEGRHFFPCFFYIIFSSTLVPCQCLFDSQQESRLMQKHQNYIFCCNCLWWNINPQKSWSVDNSRLFLLFCMHGLVWEARLKSSSFFFACAFRAFAGQEENWPECQHMMTNNIETKVKKVNSTHFDY